MSFFSKLFGIGKDSEKEKEIAIEKDVFVDDTDPSENVANVITIHYGTGFPIDAIYAFVRKDLEADGYNDAICCPDNSYRDKRIKVYKNELRTIFEQVNLKYIDLIKQLEAQISFSKDQGLEGRANALEVQKSLMDEHVRRLKELEEKFENNDSTMIGMLDSYEMGFSRGIAIKLNDLTQWKRN